MRIVYVITRGDAVGGASIHVRDLACEMKARGHEAIVLVGGEGPVTKQFRDAGVSYRSLRHLQRQINPLADWMAFRELVEVLGELRPDLVSVHTAKAGWLGRAACARLAVPVVYTAHGLAIGNRLGNLRGALYGVAERRAGRWSNAIVCVSDHERDLALRNRLCPPGRLHTIHNGVRGISSALRANPGGDAKRIVCVARMEAPKDHDTLLRAFASVDSQWVLELIGDGPLEPRVRHLAGELGVSSRVVFRGYLPDPAEALARCQAFVLSSRSEGFPRSVLEAMRAALPVIASDVGGVREAVQNSVSGILVPPHSVQPLAEALVRITLNGDTRQHMGDQGHQTWRERFRLECMVEKTATLYATLVTG